MKKLLVICTLLLAVGCASTPIKQQTVVSLSASEMALESAHDIERALCNPTADKTQAITTCETNPVGLTSVVHVQLAAMFSKAFASEKLAAEALKAWKSGEPAPSSLADYQRDILALVDTITKLLPQAKALVQKTNDASVEASKVVNTVGVK